MKTLLPILFLMPGTLYAQDCKTNKLYCSILKFDNTLDKDWAFKFSNTLYKKAKENNIDPNISLAILMQESSLKNINTFTSKIKIQKSCNDGKCIKTITEEKTVLDMGIAQININTANNYGFDLNRLFNLDEDYALDAHMIVLRDKINTCLKLGIVDFPWSCYHSTTPYLRMKYVEAVTNRMQ